MLSQLLSTIAPHYCYGCGILGSVLCEHCKNYISEEPFLNCVLCQSTTNDDNLCAAHLLPYQRLWCVARREGAVAKAIDAHKFERVQIAYISLAELLDERLPALPSDTRIVPIPTAPRNIRLRGYDHMLLIAREFARIRKLSVLPLLRRQTNVTQHFAKTARERRKQAEIFFAVHGSVESRTPHLLLDDIFTTGATVRAGAAVLRDAGVAQLWVGIIARQ